MDHQRPLPLVPRPASAAVVWLQCRAPLRAECVQPQRGIAQLQGPQSDDLICEILENIAAWLDLLQSHTAQGRYERIGATCQHIADIAERCGLLALQRAALHVARCARVDDRTALAATLARLERNFDAAVVAIWDLRDP